MANIKDLKKKIKSITGTFKITSAMKLVSAAKLAKAQAAIVGARPYAQELDKTIRTVSALVENYSHDFLVESENKKKALLVISADKGLCGGYNSQLAKKVLAFIEDDKENIKVFFIGKKVRDIIAKKADIDKTYHFEKGSPSVLEVQGVAEELSTLFDNDEYGKIYVAYNEFQSAISFTPTVSQLLPITLDQSEKENLVKEFSSDFKYAPSAHEILDSLIPQAYINSLYTCILDATAAEHGSRMAAMESAVNNCKEAIRTLTLKMNKLRQAAITTELIEVVSGAESLKNS